MQRSDLRLAGIALGMVTGLMVYWWFGRLTYQGLATRGPALLTLMTKGSTSYSAASAIELRLGEHANLQRVGRQ